MPYKKPPIEHRFKKGESGNPKGKPKGTFSLLNLLRAKIQECPKGQDKKTYADLIVRRMLKESIEKGDIQHIRIIWEYLEKKPLAEIDVNLKEVKPMMDLTQDKKNGIFNNNINKKDSSIN